MDPNWVMQYLRSDRASPVWERDYTSFEAMLTDLQTEMPIYPDQEFLNVICLRGITRDQYNAIRSLGALTPPLF
jgi:hypothetical protein